MRIFTSVSIEWPSWSALAAAISSEIAMSPATYGTAEGKVRTSVGLFFLRKRQFSDCISRFEVMQMFTSPLIPRARCMQVAKRLKLSALVAFDCVLVCLTSLNERMGGLIALPEYGSKDLFGNAIPRVESADRRIQRETLRGGPQPYCHWSYVPAGSCCRPSNRTTAAHCAPYSLHRPGRSAAPGGDAPHRLRRSGRSECPRHLSTLPWPQADRCGWRWVGRFG